MYAIINKTTGQEFPRYFNTADALKKFVIDTYGSVDKAPDNLQVVELSDADYQSRVQARGKSESEQMNKNIQTAREAQMKEDGGISPYIAPYTREAELAGREPGMVEGAKDFFSLPGRFVATDGAKDLFSLPGRFVATAGEPNFESMKVPSEKREGTIEQIVTSPATGVGVALTPLAMMAGGGIGASQLLANSPRLAPWLIGAGEGATIGVGTSTFRGMTEEEYGIADAAAETILSTILGGVLNKASAASIAKAKDYINNSGKFSPAQIDYIYSKLDITRSGTTANLKGEVPERIGDIANIPYKLTRETPEEIAIRTNWKIPEHTYVTTDIAENIPSDVAKSFKQSIESGRVQGTLNPAQKREKEAILAEFNEAMSELKGYAGNPSKYLDRLTEEANYFYSRDPELGQILLNQIEEAYKINYALMENAPTGMVELAPLSDLSGKFAKVRASTEYLANPPKAVAPRPLSVTEPGSLVGQTAGRLINTPESAKNTAAILGELRMPSIVSTQDVTGNIPQYMNLRDMQSK